MPKNNIPDPDDDPVSNPNKNIRTADFKRFDGSYDFDIKSIFKRAYNLSTKNNWRLVLALACIWAVTFTIYMLYLDAFEINDVSLLISPDTPLTPTQQLMIELSMAFALAPLWTGVSMLAIETVRKRSVPITSIFQYYKILPTVALAAICVDILFKFGFALLFIPGFYIFAVTSFTLPLIADKKMSPLTAIMNSIKMSNVYLGKIMQLFLLFLGMLAIIVVSLGFAYLWIAPFYFNVKAILYQDLFCDEIAPAKDNNSPTDKGVFNA